MILPINSISKSLLLCQTQGGYLLITITIRRPFFSFVSVCQNITATLHLSRQNDRVHANLNPQNCRCCHSLDIFMYRKISSLVTNNYYKKNCKRIHRLICYQSKPWIQGLSKIYSKPSKFHLFPSDRQKRSLKIFVLSTKITSLNNKFHKKIIYLLTLLFNPPPPLDGVPVWVLWGAEVSNSDGGM